MKLGKKLLSLLTVLCLTLSLFPTMALADGGFSVGGTGGTPNLAKTVTIAGKTLNKSTPYLVKNNNEYNAVGSEVEGTRYASFEASTGTLTLNNYIGSSGISATGDLTINLVGRNTITTSGANSIYSTGALTITSDSKGSLTAENTSSGSARTTIYSTSNITITGNATVTAKINGDAQAINSDSASGKITIADHATVTAINEFSDSTQAGTDSIAILAGNNKADPKGTIEVKGSATLTAKGYGKALACQTFSATGTVKASTDYQPETPVDYVKDDLGSYKYVKVTPAVVNYDVWVGNKQVTSANKDNVLGVTNANGTPTVTYTPASTSGEETTPQKLTLNGARITSNTAEGIKTNSALVIDLIGTNTITGTDNSILSYGPLTITSADETKGSLTMSSEGDLTTVYAEAAITIQGSAVVNATINGGAQAIHSNPSSGTGSITITGNAKVTAKNTRTLGQTSDAKDAHSVALLTGTYGSTSGTITVSDSASLLAQGSTQALKCETFTATAQGLITEVSKNYTGAKPETTYNSSSFANYKYVHVHPSTDVVKYDVWVGRTQVTSTNKGNVLNDSNTTHAVTYDPATQTLTLTDATITGAPNRQYTSKIKDACGIYAKHDLTIKLIGDNNKVQGAAEQADGSYGIFVSGKLTFIDGRTDTTDSTATPSITVSGGTSINSGNAWVPGVYASGITVNNCNVTAIGGTASDSYPVAYAMSKAPTLVGAEVVATNTTNSDKDTSTEYNALSIRQYKYLKITQKNDDTVAAPVITPEGGYFTGSQNVTISCPTDGATIYYTTDGSDPQELTTQQTYSSANPISFTITEGKTIKAFASKGEQKSDVVTATFTNRTGDAVTAVALDVSVDTHKLTLKAGDTQTLSAAVKHEETPIDGPTVTWESDNADVATVENGKITALAVGKARVTAFVVENGVTYSDFCDVIVEARPASSHHSSSSTTYYDVNAAVSGEGGSVAAGTKRASKGTTVTVTATAASGYQVAQVSAVDKDGKTVSLTDKGDGVYTFVMPASKVNVTARFAQVQKPEEKDPYGDVSKDSYYYDAVKWAAETGVTTGVGDGLFAPEWVCTRGQIVTFLWRASGSPAPKATELPFTDVAADAYYAQAVLWAVENGITNGTSETTFSPDQTCTRAHAVAFLYRMSGSPAAAGSTFSDVAADAYYRAAVAWAVEKGITNGTSGTTFSPDDTCTRGQIVTFLYRLAQTK